MQQQTADVPAPPPSPPVSPQLPGIATVGAWRWPRYDSVRQASAVLLAGAVVTGVLVDAALRSGTAALGLAAAVWAIVASVLASRLTRNPWAAGCFVGAAVLAACLVLRASPWLVGPDLVAIWFLLALGVSLAERGSPFDLGWSTFWIRVCSAIPLAFWFPGWLLRPVAGLVGRAAGHRRSDAVALARGLAIAVPIAVVLGLLLGSADPVFSSLVSGNRFADPGDLVLHAVLIGTGALLVGMLGGAMAIGFRDAPAVRPAGGSREALVVMAVIDVLFALFAVAQAVAAMGGGAGALRDAGVSPAEYARSGFFQLLWVAGLSWIVIVVARMTVPAERGPRRLALIASIEVAIGLVLLIVYVAHARLQLYEVAFGFTTARLYSHVFAGLVAAGFVLLGVSVAGVGSDRRWLFGAVAALTLVTLLGLDAVNPEAVVVGQNLQRAQATGKLDVYYLANLSDDATPSTLSGAAGLPAEQRAELRMQACSTRRPAIPGWASYSVATQAAIDARLRDCAGT
jgi:hypothetical protein